MDVGKVARGQSTHDNVGLLVHSILLPTDYLNRYINQEITKEIDQLVDLLLADPLGILN